MREIVVEFLKGALDGRVLLQERGQIEVVTNGWRNPVGSSADGAVNIFLYKLDKEIKLNNSCT